jgi:hypothetical protein
MNNDLCPTCGRETLESEAARAEEASDKTKKENETEWELLKQKANEWTGCCQEFQQNRKLVGSGDWFGWNPGTIFPDPQHIWENLGRRMAWMFVTSRPSNVSHPDIKFMVYELIHCPWCLEELPVIGGSPPAEDRAFINKPVTYKEVVDTVRSMRKSAVTV